MSDSLTSQFALQNLLEDLQIARENQQLGKLALLAYCDVKRWARQAGRTDVAEQAFRMFSERASISKDDFLREIDAMVGALQEYGIERSSGINNIASASVCATRSNMQY